MSLIHELLPGKKRERMSGSFMTWKAINPFSETPPDRGVVLKESGRRHKKEMR